MVNKKRLFVSGLCVLALSSLCAVTALAYDPCQNISYTKAELENQGITLPKPDAGDADYAPGTAPYVPNVDNYYEFGGSADFWESRVATVSSKPTNGAYCYRYYFPSNNFYLYTTCKNSNDNVTSVKTKMAPGHAYAIATASLKGQEVRLTAAREYWLDPKTGVRGYFVP